MQCHLDKSGNIFKAFSTLELIHYRKLNLILCDFLNRSETSSFALFISAKGKKLIFFRTSDIIKEPEQSKIIYHPDSDDDIDEEDPDDDLDI